VSDYILRPISLNDNAKLADVIRNVLKEHGVDRPGTVYTDPTTDHLFELFDSEESAHYFVATDNKDTIIGGCGIYPTEGLPEGCVELVKLYVHKDFRGKGIGKALMEASIDVARNNFDSVYLETMPELSNALQLYRELGFKTINKRLGESGHFSCNIWMLKKLS
jgi:putative acetyltransferase